MADARYVQFGSGWVAPREWRNFDASPTLRFERLPLIGRLSTKNQGRFPTNVEYGDIVKGLPVARESCCGIYCSHVLEHLSLADFRVALRNTMEMLRPGGIFRFVVPDLEYLTRRYLEDPSSEASLKFMRDSYLGHEARARGLSGFVVSWLGNSKHLWMWDYKSMKAELEKAGFTEVRRASIGDSSEPMFGKVEDRSRWENCLGIECRKPA